jgi:hypothetical protein
VPVTHTSTGVANGVSTKDRLAEYRSKRDLARSGEPRGSRRRARDVPRFVVQRHDASTLHFDFRLQVGDALVSWAVPKGPSLNEEQPPSGDAEDLMNPEDQSWEQWPERLSSRAHQVLEQIRTGHPDLAVDVIDELISDLGSRREILAEGANRRFEPSTDDRHL